MTAPRYWLWTEKRYRLAGLIAEGMGYEEAGKEVGLCEATVKTYMSQVKEFREYVDTINCSINDQELRDAFEVPEQEWYNQPIAYIVKNHMEKEKHHGIIAFEKDIVEAGIVNKEGLGLQYL